MEPWQFLFLFGILIYSDGFTTNGVTIRNTHPKSNLPQTSQLYEFIPLLQRHSQTNY